MPFSPGTPQAGSPSTRRSRQLRNASPEWGQPLKQRAGRLNGLHRVQTGHKVQRGNAAAAQGWQLPEPPSSAPTRTAGAGAQLGHPADTQQHTSTLPQRAALHSHRLHCPISSIAFFLLERETTHSLESHASQEGVTSTPAPTQAGGSSRDSHGTPPHLHNRAAAQKGWATNCPRKHITPVFKHNIFICG